MCGVAGMLRFDNRPADAQILAAMRQCLRHRGPDDAGDFVDGALGLAFRRLAILDLSPAGHQPMAGTDGTTILVFNGEIYNYRQLRAELAGRGHTFRSESDTEVLLASYAEWGVDCLAHLSGMWAFALWDARRQRLLCARDRFGIKPFYYHLNAERLLFASEIPALFVDSATPNRANDRRIYDFLVYGFVDHGDETCFDSIRQLPAAHSLVVEAGSATPTVRRYWDIDSRKRLDLADDVAAEQFRTLLADSVRRHLQSDVPIGTCLSGGLDSSSIVVIINQLLRDGGLDRSMIGERQKTFSACYDDPRYDERRFMQAVVEQTGVANAKVFPDAPGLLADLDAFVEHQGEPVGSTSVYAQWCVMRLAREHGVTVLLDGQGADELLMGYPIYQAAWWATLARRGQFGLLAREVGAYGRRFGRARMLRLREAARLALPEGLAARLGALGGSARPNWLGPRIGERHFRRPPIEAPFADPLHRLMYGFLATQNLPALLRYEDRNSMAFGIEARVPFLDERLVEMAFALPARQLARDGESKWIMRQALRGLLPEVVRARQDKIGFATPGDTWLRGALAPLVDELLASNSMRNRGYVDPGAAGALWARHKAGAVNAHGTLWRCIHLELWARRFLDQRPLTSDRVSLVI